MDQSTIETHEISVAIREVVVFLNAINDNLIAHSDEMIESLNKLTDAVRDLAHAVQYPQPIRGTVRNSPKPKSRAKP